MELNNKTISSIRNHCNNINYIIRLFLYIALILASISLIYTIVMLVVFGGSLEVCSFKDEFVIKSSNLSFWIDGRIQKSLIATSLDQPFSNITLTFIIAQLLYFVKRASVILILYFINKILKNIENSYTPFIIENANKIKLVGLLLIAYSVVPNLIAFVLLKMVTNNVILELDSSIPIIFSASFILLLSKIFKYGCELQKDSDETL